MPFFILMLKCDGVGGLGEVAGGSCARISCVQTSLIMCRDKLIHYTGGTSLRCSAAICKLQEATECVRSARVAPGNIYIFYYYCFCLCTGVLRETHSGVGCGGGWGGAGAAFCWAPMDSSIQTRERMAPLMDSSHCDGKVALLPSAGRRLISVKFNGRHCAKFPIKPPPPPPPPP